MKSDSLETTSEVATISSGSHSLEPAPPARRDRFLRAALQILLVAMIGLAGLQCVLFALEVLTARYTGYDFSIYYAAALAIRDNAHANIFDLHLLQAAAHAHGAAVPAAIYTYPPLLAVSFLPLTFVSYRVALTLWTVANFAAWFICAALFTSWLRRAFIAGAEAAGDEGASRRAGGTGVATPAPRFFMLVIAVFLTLSYQPIEQTLVLGQVSLIILLLLVLTPWLVERDHPYVAGAMLALAVWIKLFPVVLIVYYVLRGRWRVAGGAAVSLVLLALVQVPIIGVDGVLATRHVLDNGSFQAAQFHNEALARVPLWIAAELGGHLTTPLTVAGFALAALVACIFLVSMWHLRRRMGRADVPPTASADAANRELLGYAWALTTMVLVSPITWEHYDSWLLPAIIVCLGLALRGCAAGFRDAHGHVRREVYALVAIIVAYVLTMHHLPFGYDGTTTFDIGPFVAGHPLRPFFMVLRPLAALLVWLCSGALFLRVSSRQPVSVTPGEARPHNQQLSSLPLSIQARVVGGLLCAVVVAQIILIYVMATFGPYGPRQS